MEGEIEGFVCTHDVGFLGYLSIIVVSERSRGKGIGWDLAQHMEQDLATRGCVVLIADTWKDAVGSYKGLGWTLPEVVLMRNCCSNLDLKVINFYYLSLESKR